MLAKGDGSDFESITKEGGIYERVIKFFNAANRAGIVDPESTTQNYDTMNSKYKNGKVLFSFWPWLGQAAYNTNANKAEGKGFMLAPLKDMKIFSYGAAPRGDKTMIALGSKAKNKQRLVKFINWLYSPEGVYASSNQTGGSAGPKGLNWEIKDGKPVLTEFGSAVLSGESKNVPEEWGGGSYSDGISALNFTTVTVNDIDPDTGYTYNPVMWPSEIEKANQNPLNKDWQEHMGASTTMEYLENNDMLLVGAGSSYVQPEENSQISTLRGSIKTEIVNSSWKASFASSESECEKIFNEMIKTVNGLDIDSVLKVDMKNAKDQDKARKNILKEYQNKEKSSSSDSSSE